MRAATHPDLDWKSQSYDMPIIPRARHWKDKGSSAKRFEFSTGVIEYQYRDTPSIALLPAQLLVEEQVHPRKLPRDHPRNVQMRGRMSPTPRKPRVYKPIPCRCCAFSFTPKCPKQVDCLSCRTLIPAKLRRAPGRVAHDLSLAQAWGERALAGRDFWSVADAHKRALHADKRRRQRAEKRRAKAAA